METAARELDRGSRPRRFATTQPKLRKLLILELKQQFDQIIDEISQDELLEAGTGAADAKERARRALVQLVRARTWRSYRDEIDALQFFYSAAPTAARLRYDDMSVPSPTPSAPRPVNWTPEAPVAGLRAAG